MNRLHCASIVLVLSVALTSCAQDADPANGDFFVASSSDGHFMFDLPGYVAGKLDALGIAFETTGEDSCSDEARFFSYRRATNRGEEDYGRGLSAILLADG